MLSDTRRLPGVAVVARWLFLEPVGIRSHSGCNSREMSAPSGDAPVSGRVYPLYQEHIF
jgi:hypothetical protein